MSRPAARLIVLVASLNAAAAVRLASQVEEECSLSMMYEMLGEDCYDSNGEPVARECCETYETCRQDVTALGRACAARVQRYFEDCQLLESDASTEGTEDGELRIVDTARICSASCQAEPAFASDLTLKSLEELETRCSPHLDRIRMMIQAAQHFDATWLACSSAAAAEEPEPLESVKSRKPRWGPVEISIRWVPPVLNLKAAFETMWTALPCSYSDEFRIKGSVGAIQEELLLRPELPISCPNDHMGQPVHLVVGKLTDSGYSTWKQALSNGLANVAGLSALATGGPAMLHIGGKGTRLLGVLAHNPSKYNLDNAIDFALNHAHLGSKRSLKKFGRWMRGTKTEAFLTLADPVKKNHRGPTITWQCNMMPVDGEPKPVATWVDAGDAKVVVTAKHLAFLITRLA